MLHASIAQTLAFRLDTEVISVLISRKKTSSEEDKAAFRILYFETVCNDAWMTLFNAAPECPGPLLQVLGSCKLISNHWADYGLVLITINQGGL